MRESTSEREGQQVREKRRQMRETTSGRKSQRTSGTRDNELNRDNESSESKIE